MPERKRRSSSQRPQGMPQRALSLLQETSKHTDLQLVYTGRAEDPATGESLHEFVAVSRRDPNGPSYRIVLDSRGEPRERVVEPDALARASTPVRLPAAAVPRASATIRPSTNVLTLNPDESFTETVRVAIPKSGGTAKADVYFLADTTGSMGPILGAVQAGANTILTALNGLGLDLMFGVGNYRDFPPSAPPPFTHHLSPTNVTASITAAIGAWSAAGGGDTPEGQLLAFDRLAQSPGGSIGWRAGAKRIIVWFGDAPGHDPICPAITGLPSAITEASVTARLTTEQIAVLAISTAVPGLDADPVPISTDYTATCGPPGGAGGQGTRLATATGGAFITGINPATIVTTIINLVTAAVSSITKVMLVPSSTLAPFIVSITPAGGYGPLSGAREHVLEFVVTFRGIPCRDRDQVFTSALDVVADGRVIASKPVRITVPACKPKTIRYSVKFVCGRSEDGCHCKPVRPGRYATHISIHNYSNDTVAVRKRVIPVILAGAAAGREPKVVHAQADDAFRLPPHTATMDDCCRLSELLFGALAQGLTIGLLEITASREVAVTAVYTGSAGVDVEPVRGRAV